MVQKLRERILRGPGGVDRPLTREEMVAHARSVDLAKIDLADCASFQKERYTRNRIHLNDQFELVVICWLPGQESSIHDHGKSNCLYLVVAGTMEEELFEPVPGGKPRRTRARAWNRGDVMVAAGSDIHRIRNATGEKLVTVHLYSPPLDEHVRHFTPIPTYA